MRLKLISCEVFTREVCHCVARSPHVIDLEFTEKGQHEHPEVLRAHLQARIDACAATAKYQAILLCFGLCGNATLDLQAKSVPLVIPRAHDCCTLFLGGKEAFTEHFSHRPSARFTSTGYMERGEDSFAHDPSTISQSMGGGKSYEGYVRDYGEENARYIWETLHASCQHFDKSITFIDIPETSHLGGARQCEAKAGAEGLTYSILPGSLSLIEKLIYGDWHQKDFLIVQPGQRIAGLYDWDEIVAAKE